MKSLSFSKRILNNQRDLKSYKDANITHYIFVATLDDMTCEICGDMDGKVFPVNKALIGKNCPPLHEYCRCTTVAYIKGHFPKTRFARDPITHRGMQVPYMTYTEYKKLFNIDNQQDK